VRLRRLAEWNLYARRTISFTLLFRASAWASLSLRRRVARSVASLVDRASELHERFRRHRPGGPERPTSSTTASASGRWRRSRGPSFPRKQAPRRQIANPPGSRILRSETTRGAAQPERARARGNDVLWTTRERHTQHEPLPRVAHRTWTTPRTRRKRELPRGVAHIPTGDYHDPREIELKRQTTARQPPDEPAQSQSPETSCEPRRNPCAAPKAPLPVQKPRSAPEPGARVTYDHPRSPSFCRCSRTQERGHAAELLAEIGDCRERYPTADALAADAGMSAVAIESGKRKVASFRWGCDKRLRDAFGVLADTTRRWHPWAGDHDARAIQRGHDHPRAIRTLGRAWCRVIWRCWQDRVPYDPATAAFSSTSRS